VLTFSESDVRFLAALRAREFSRLDEYGLAYLDYTGSALYGASQIRAHQQMLERGLFGNPHSEHSASVASTEAIERAREDVLGFFGVTPDTHAVCFTANATAAIGLVASGYPFSRRHALVLTADNHNSINGIREYAARAGARVDYLALDRELRLDDGQAGLKEVAAAGCGGLFAFPAQSNFSGVRHPLSLVRDARQLGFDVLLDAASFAATAALDLRTCPADFTVVSFYKLFGFPTGLGALVATRAALSRLRRPWFAGGTVTYASVAIGQHELRASHEAFEDGTPNFLGIAALEPGFRLLDDAGPERTARHVAELTGELLAGLSALRHRNGEPLVEVYGPPDVHGRGPTVACNVFDSARRPVPFQIVETRAREARVAVRGGCFCNPGASEAAFGYSEETLRRCMMPGFTIERFAACAGAHRPIGAVRISPGLATNRADVARAIELVASFIE
jgi:selenocysteine lyase/cysteine desulfurase